MDDIQKGKVVKKIITLTLLFIFLNSSNAFALNIPNKFLSNEKDTITIFNRTAPYVVNVHNLKTVVTPYLESLQVKQGVGSGILWSKKGYVVTNFHVINGANRIAVTLLHGQTVLANVIGADPHKDIAVLQLDDLKPLHQYHPFQPIPLANSNHLLVGQTAIAIGNPYGLERTLTTGVVSALHRQVPGYGGVSIRDMIQTDASINPGNSGGPLLDSQGRLIGINTMIFSRSGGSTGVGFALPSNQIQRIVGQLIKYGKVIQPSIGIQPLSDQVSAYLGIRGLIIGRVLPHSPAANAKLHGSSQLPNGRIRLGDIIVQVDNKKIKNYDDFYNALSHKKIGEKVTIQYIRNGRQYSTMLKTVNVE